MPELLNIIGTVITPIFIIIGLSVLVARIFNPDPRPISTILIYLMIPALVFRGIAFSTLTGTEIIGIAGVVLAISVLTAIVGMVIARVMKFDRRLEGAFLVSVILMNAANYGTPINTFAFGADAEAYAIFYYAMSALFGLILGIYFASRGQVDARQAFINVFKVPVTYAAILGLVFNLIISNNPDFALPLTLQRAIDVLAEGAIPGMLVLLGLQLARVTLKGQIIPILLATGVRLILAPLMAVPIALLLNLSGVPLMVAIVQSGMPTAVISSAIATEFDSDAGFTSAVTLVSTLASILTLSILLTILA